MTQAIILSAGKGVRMQPLTQTRPKPLLRILNTTILEHNLNQLDGIVEDVIIIIGYKGEMVKSVIGDKYGSMNIRYVEQKEQLGTGDAARQALPLLKDKFILLNGDDLYFREDIKKCLAKYPSILLGHVKNPSFFGVVDCYDDFVRGIIEKPEKCKPNSLVNTGLYCLDKSIFDFKIEKSSRGEFEFTDYIKFFLSNERLRFHSTEKWFPVSHPWNLLEANESMLGDMRVGIMGAIKGNVDNGCFIIGNVVIESGAVIKNGTRIEGPVYICKDATIGPNAYIRANTVIGPNCNIGSGVEIKNSVIGGNSKIPHLTYVGDSVIGEDCNISGGTIIANYRLDKSTVKVIVKDKKIDTLRVKFGTVLGDNVNIGVNCSIMPGVMIGANSIIGPNSLVKKNVLDNVKYFTKFDEIIEEK